MSKPSIAIAIDVFSPAAYRPTPWPAGLGAAPSFFEDYGHEKDFVYVVLQPMLFRGVSTPGNYPAEATPDPASYFSPARRLRADEVMFAADLPAAVPAGIVAVPVSLPPGTQIELELVRGGNLLWHSGQRQIGQTASGATAVSPFVLRLVDWPPIASVNFAHPIANSARELDATQLEEVYVWLAAAVVDLVRAQSEGKVLTAAQVRALGIFAVSNLPPTWDEMRVHLVQDMRGCDMYDALLAERDNQPWVKLTPPRFKVVDGAAFDQRVRSDIGLALPGGATQASYLYVWWQAICRQAISNPVDAWRDLAKPSEVANALGRYFGFGERLRWPKPDFDLAGLDNQVFMVPRLDSAGGRFETNAASLCELVFRIPVGALAGDPSTLRARLSVAGCTYDDAQRPAWQQFGPHLADVASQALGWNTAAHCHAAVRRDDVDESGNPLADARGITMVQPRAARCVPIPNAKAPGMFAVPTLLMELADASPRHEIGDGEDGLLAQRQPRRALLPEECLAFEKVLQGKTRWRIPGELRIAAVLTWGNTLPSPRVYEFIAARLSRAPVAGASAPNNEAERFRQLLPVLLAGGGEYRADLWMPNGADVFRLEGRLVDADGPDSDLRFYILDENPASGIGNAWPGTSDSGHNGLAADIVIEIVAGKPGTAQAQASMPFNIVASSDAEPWVALNRSALSRVGRSTDRWLERFHVTPIAEGTMVQTESLTSHLLNFNKLRVYSAGATGAYVPVTYPDAAVPLRPSAPGTYAATLPWEAGWPTQKTSFTYFVGHLYSQENETQRPDVGDAGTTLDRKPEELRYVRYGRAQANEHLAGYVEHQYSYRIPIVQPDWSADARIATDVRNVAALVSRSKGTARTLGHEKDNEGPKASLLEVRLVPSSNAVEIAGRTDYFKYAFQAEADLEMLQSDGRTAHVETLRAIYESVQDLKHALVSGAALLQAALFRFDNSLPRNTTSAARGDVLPERLDRFVTGTLALRHDAGVGKALLDGLQPLLPPTFEEFRQAIDTLRRSGTTDVFPPIPVALGDGAWVWRDADGLRGAPDLEADANVIRLALELHRPAEFVVSPDAAAGRLIAFNPSQSDIPKWIADETGTVLDSAREELRALLARPSGAAPGSSLYFRRDWLHAEAPSGNVEVEPGKTEPREGRWRMIFGDYASTLLVPAGQMRRTAQVCELFYLPMAFRPLAAHPTLVSANDTLSFTEFLLGSAGDLLEGRAPECIVLGAAPGAAASEGALAQLRMQALLESATGIAATLLELLVAVHNDADLRTNPGPLTQRALKLWDVSTTERRAAIRTLLSQSPQVFATARAIGVGLFDPQRFARSLQSMQLWKRITQDVATGAEPVVDVDRFVIRPSPPRTVPLVLDPLEAARYDAEFELPSNVYKDAHGAVAGEEIYASPVNLDSGVTIASRGAASGRSGEDFIESRHHFPLPEAAVGSRRAVELDAPHWNPHWAYIVQAKDGSTARTRLYLLPARRFPSTPVPLQVAAASGALAVNVSAINLRATDAGDPDVLFERTLKDALHDLDSTPIEVRAEGAQAAQAQPTWVIQPNTTRRVNYRKADGWYRIDTFLEHHYFLVEAGETGESAFANDMFEIEVQVNRAGTFEDAPEPVPVASGVVPSSALLRAFRRWQQKTGQVAVGTSTIAPADRADAMTIPQLAESIAYWLCPDVADRTKVPQQEQIARGELELLRQAKLGASDAATVHFRAQYSTGLDPGEPLLPTPNPASRRIGSVVTVSRLRPDTQQIARGERAILRVSVLADPWSRLRVRMRQVRNRRDLDGGQPDIDPVFEMPSPYSGWSAYAHSEIELDRQKFADSQVPDTERKLLVTRVTLSEWLLPRGDSDPLDIGTLVGTRLASAIPPGGPYAGLPYWNAAEMLDGKRQVTMVLRQRQPDRHMTDAGGVWQPKPQPQRDFAVPRHVFGTLPADQIDLQLAAAAPTAVTAGEPELEIRWLDKSSGGPVYRINWPIRFARK